MSLHHSQRADFYVGTGQQTRLVCVFIKAFTVLLVPHYQNKNSGFSKFCKVFKCLCSFCILVKCKVLIRVLYALFFFFFPLDLLMYLFQFCINTRMVKVWICFVIVNCCKDGDISVVKLSLCLWLLV